jgi:hypothetical protein
MAGLGRVAVAQVHERAVLPVGVRRAQRLVGDGQDARALLARGLGHELLDPQPERAERGIDGEGQLVAPVDGELTERQTQPQPAVGLRGVEGDAGLLGHARALQQRTDVGAHERGGHQPEGRQRAVAPADLRVTVEDAPELVLARELLDARARIGDGHEAPPVGSQRPEAVEQRDRLDRPARLRGHQEQRPLRVDGLLHGAHGVWVRGVQDVQAREPLALPEAAPQHLGGQ